jgi:hypothetical protein
MFTRRSLTEMPATGAFSLFTHRVLATVLFLVLVKAFPLTMIALICWAFVMLIGWFAVMGKRGE